MILMVAHKCTPLRNIPRTQSDSDIERPQWCGERPQWCGERPQWYGERPQWSGSGCSRAEVAAVERDRPNSVGRRAGRSVVKMQPTLYFHSPSARENTTPTHAITNECNKYNMLYLSYV